MKISKTHLCFKDIPPDKLPLAHRSSWQESFVVPGQLERIDFLVMGWRCFSNGDCTSVLFPYCKLNQKKNVYVQKRREENL